MNSFNIRVYGILINDKDQILLADACIRGANYTKFPGGGLEFGEGTRDCLAREFREEMDLSVRVGEHIYTTDFFQVSAFNPRHQIVSVYYYVYPLETIRFPLRETPFQFDQKELDLYNETGETETFRFLDMEAFSPAIMSLPIDKIVAALLKK